MALAAIGAFIAANPLMTGMIAGGVAQIAGGLFANHKAKKQQEEMLKAQEQSQAQFAQMMAPYLQSNAQCLQASQQMAFGMTQQSMGVGVSPQQFQQQNAGPGQFPQGMGFRGYA